MNDLTDIFMPPTDDSDPAAELDRELATAGQVLQKLAEAEGIDIDSLGEEHVADLLTMLHSGDAGVETPTPEEQTKEANYEMTDTITNADVAVELAKVASDHGVDLNQVSREEYHEAFDALAGEMSNPEYFTKQAEQAEKLAEAEGIGRHMARAFKDELNADGEKVAFEGNEGHRGDYGDIGTTTREPKGRKTTLSKNKKKLVGGQGYAKGGKANPNATKHLHTMGDRAKDTLRRGGEAVKGVASKADSLVARGGEKALGLFSKKPATMRAARMMGYGGAGAAAALAAGGVAALASRKKAALDESFESDAANYGVSLLVDAGLVEPVEVEYSKFASYANDEYQELVEKRAYELLEENGWLEA